MVIFVPRWSQGLGMFGLRAGHLKSCVVGAEASDVGWSFL
jgi:hypothetical protein